MNRLAFPLALVLLGGAVGAAAQEDPDPLDGPTEEREAGAVVVVAGYEFDVQPDDPIQACVLATGTSLDGSTVTASLVTQPVEGIFVYPPDEYAAVGPLAEAAVGTCYGLSGEGLD
ncbi:MAG: hypothetical protein H0W36_14160 [Gemmatimonadetes bacterium]|nr:hypothetical protein [Gemmatimonadota bacterium]